MRTDELLKSLRRYSLPRLARESDERITGVLEKRISALASTNSEACRRHGDRRLRKFVLSALGSIAMLVIALNMSMSRHEPGENGIAPYTNANLITIVSRALAGDSNVLIGSSVGTRGKAHVFPVAMMTPTRGRSSRNCWAVASLKFRHKE